MTRTLFTLGARLRAAETGQPTPLAAYAPVIPALNAIAVTVDTDGERVYLTATDGYTDRAGTGRNGLDALAQLGATMTAPRRTLIVGTRRDLTILAALARIHPTADASPVIGWWDERADFPGTDAVHIVTATARLRWALGVHPDLERDPATWAHWMHIDSTGPTALLDLARLTASGHTLPDLLHASILDTASWERYSKRLTAGRPWFLPDTRTDAALGLIARSHAAEWYESIRLSDPLIALAASHDGTLVPGTVIARNGETAVIEADRALSRLRTDTKVSLWIGEPLDSRTKDYNDGAVAGATIDHNARLTLTITGLPKRNTTLTPGIRVTARPARVDPSMQARARGLTATGYRRGENWIAGRGTPVLRRGNVPLDVIVAAAED